MTGCAIQPTSEQLAAVGTVAIDEVVDDGVTFSGTLPREYDIDEENSLLNNMLTAPIGLFVEMFSYRSKAARRSKRLRDLFANAKLDLPAWLRSEFRATLEKSDLFKAVTVSCDGVDATVHLSTEYGITGGAYMDDRFSPWVRVHASLVTASGDEIWRVTREVEGGDGRVRELPFPDPFFDQELLREQYREAARELSKQLLLHLTRTK